MASAATARVLRNAPPSRARLGGTVGLLALVTIAVYVNTLGLGFVWDDNYQILRNQFLRDLHYIPQIFTSPFWGFLNPQQAQTTNFYRPLQSLTYMLCYALFGLAPWGFHLVSVLLHVGAVLMAFFLLRRLNVDHSVALVAALLFATHPIHTESVTWVAGVPDVLCALFYFLAFYGYWDWSDRAALRRAGLMVGAGAAYFLALLSKEMALTFPLLIWAAGWLYRDRPGAPRGKAWLWHLGPFLAITLVYVFIRWRVLGFFATTQNALALDFFDLLLLRIIFIFDYVGEAVLPVSLSAYHLVRLSGLATDVRLYGGVAVLAAAIWAVVRWRVRAPHKAFAVLWFFLTLAPVLHLRAVSVMLFAERYLYIPSLGACLLGALLLSEWSLRRRASPGRGASGAGRPFRLVLPVALVLILFSLATVRRNFDWKDNRTLFAKTAQTAPHSALVQNYLGMEYLTDPRTIDRAQQAFEEALRVQSLGYYQSGAEDYRAYIGLGVVQFQKRTFAAARAAFARALELDPNREWAYSYLAAVRIQNEGDLAEGLRLLRQALALNPNNEVTHHLMGVALFNAGRYAEAAAEFQAALQILPGSAESRESLRRAQAQMKGK